MFRWSVACWPRAVVLGLSPELLPLWLRLLEKWEPDVWRTGERTNGIGLFRLVLREEEGCRPAAFEPHRTDEFGKRSRHNNTRPRLCEDTSGVSAWHRYSKGQIPMRFLCSCISCVPVTVCYTILTGIFTVGHKYTTPSIGPDHGCVVRI